MAMPPQPMTEYMSPIPPSNPMNMYGNPQETFRKHPRPSPQGQATSAEKRR